MFKKNLWIVALLAIVAIAFIGCLDALPVEGGSSDPNANPIVEGAAFLRVFNKTANSWDTIDIKTSELLDGEYDITVWGKSSAGSAHSYGNGLSPWHGLGRGETSADKNGMFMMTRDFSAGEISLNVRINCPQAVPEFFVYEILIEDKSGKAVYQMSKDPEIQDAIAGEVVIDGGASTIWLTNSGGAKAEVIVPGAAAAEPLDGVVELDSAFAPAFYVNSEIIASFKPAGADPAFVVASDEVTNYTFAWRGEGQADTEYDAATGKVVSTIMPTATGPYTFIVTNTATGNIATGSVSVTNPSAGTLAVSGGSPGLDSLVTITHTAPAGVAFTYQWGSSTGKLYNTKDFTPTELGLHTLVATAVAPAFFAGAKATLDIMVANLVPGGNLTIAGGSKLTTANITLTATHATPGAVPGGTTYQWFKDGAAIGSATASTFVVVNSFANTGTYKVVASAAGYGARESSALVMTKAAAFNVAFPDGPKAVAEAAFTVDGNTFTGIDTGYRIFGSDYGDVTQFKLNLANGAFDDIVNISFTVAMPSGGGGKNYMMVASLNPIDDGLPGTVRGTAAANSRATVWSEKGISGAGTDEGIYFGTEPDQAGVYVIVKNPGTGRPGWGAANTNAYAWDNTAHPMNLLVGDGFTAFKAAFNTASAGGPVDVYIAIYANTSSGDGGVIDVTNIGFFSGAPGWKQWNGTAFGIPTGVIDASTSGNADVWGWFAGDAPAGCIKGQLAAPLVTAFRELGANGKLKVTWQAGADGNLGGRPSTGADGASNFNAYSTANAGATEWEVPVLGPDLMTGGNAGRMDLNTWSASAGVLKIEILEFR